MHVLFVHQTFPAQFGHIAKYLVEQHGFRATFVSKAPPGNVEGIELVQYPLRSGATEQTHYCSRTFENAVWNAAGVYEALRGRKDIQPDLVVGHSGFGSTIFLRELYDCPIVNYFEYFYRPHNSDMDFRPEFPSLEIDRLRAYTRNAMLLADLENCDLGYSPTRWQRDRLPDHYHDKVRVAFDGIDTAFWRPQPQAPRVVAGRAIPAEMKIVTYASRGFESIRGFDIFMKTAKRLAEQHSDVIFIVVGEDRICYGGDQKTIGGESFLNWVLAQDQYDLSRFIFTGLLPPDELSQLFSISDLHIYLTVPFVLSWSLMDALACGATVLASDTAPVQEMITHGRNGLLADFFDVDAFVGQASLVLDAPQDFKHLGQAAAQMIRERYSLDVCDKLHLQLYQDAVTAGR